MRLSLFDVIAAKGRAKQWRSDSKAMAKRGLWPREEAAAQPGSNGSAR